METFFFILDSNFTNISLAKIFEQVGLSPDLGLFCQKSTGVQPLVSLIAYVAEKIYFFNVCCT